MAWERGTVIHTSNGSMNVIVNPKSRLLTQSMQEGTPDIMIANHRGKLTVGDNKKVYILFFVQQLFYLFTFLMFSLLVQSLVARQ